MRGITMLQWVGSRVSMISRDRIVKRPFGDIFAPPLHLLNARLVRSVRTVTFTQMGVAVRRLRLITSTLTALFADGMESRQQRRPPPTISMKNRSHFPLAGARFRRPSPHRADKHLVLRGSAHCTSSERRAGQPRLASRGSSQSWTSLADLNWCPVMSAGFRR